MTAGLRAQSIWRALRLTVTALLLAFLIAPMIIVVIIITANSRRDGFGEYASTVLS